jgi:hypothetical protein
MSEINYFKKFILCKIMWHDGDLTIMNDVSFDNC